MTDYCMDCGRSKTLDPDTWARQRHRCAICYQKLLTRWLDICGHQVLKNEIVHLSTICWNPNHGDLGGYAFEIGLRSGQVIKAITYVTQLRGSQETATAAKNERNAVIRLLRGD